MALLRHLISHLWQSNKDEIVSRSLLNCDCVGLHSIMLLESPEKTIRLYVATENHQTWRNCLKNGNLSVGFHPHHCDITLHCIKGKVLNWCVQTERVNSDIRLFLPKYKYQSKITQGESSFELVDKQEQLFTSSYKWLKPNQSVFMPANKIHTIGLIKRQIAAWLVYEGKEDKNYMPYLWTNLNPEDGMDGLYLKPNEEDIINLLAIAGLKI